MTMEQYRKALEWYIEKSRKELENASDGFSYLEGHLQGLYAGNLQAFEIALEMLDRLEN